MSESFWLALKTESYGRKKWASCDEARKAEPQWIEIVYNRRRRYSAIWMVSPANFEAQNKDPKEKKQLLNHRVT